MAMITRMPRALFKGKVIVRIKEGYKIVGSDRVFSTLPAATDSIK